MRTQWLNAGTGYDSLAGTVGAWRSPGAHLHGVQGVVSSNLTAPTSYLSFIFKDRLHGGLFVLLKGREEELAGSRLRVCHEVRRGHENRRGSAVQYPGEDLQGMDRILLDRLIQYAENKAGYKLDSKQEEGPSLPRFSNPG